jgi:ADYC domain
MQSMIISRLVLVLTGSMLVLVGCDEALAPESLSFRDLPSGHGVISTWPPSGGTFNTASLGVTPLMRLLPPGSPALAYEDDGVVVQIEVLDGAQYFPVTSVSAPHGMLEFAAAGVRYEGLAVLGSRWWLDDAHTHYVTITEVSEQGLAFGYQLEHHIVGADAKPICEADVVGDHWAYLVADVLVDVHDGTITHQAGPLLVACASGALGKAISWGFSPWDTTLPEALSLYQTGVRTVRADYCGDGSSYTEDGVLIQVYNQLAGQSFAVNTVSDEAIFGPDGALCLSNPRNEGVVPACTLPPCMTRNIPIIDGFHTWTKLAPE